MNTINNKTVTVIGLGNAGVKILNKLYSLPEAAWLKLLAVDTDKNSLENCRIDHTISAGFDWTEGYGCGGDPAKGERTLSLCRRQISDYIKESALVIVTGGLGGGTGTGGASIIASVAKNHKIPCIFLMTTPFSFEGMGKKRIAEDGLKELLLTVDIILPMPNDLLFSSLPADASFEDSFQKVDEEVARTILGVCEVIRCQNFISIDLADFKNLLDRRKATCAIGVGKVNSEDGEQRCHLAVEKMLEAPLLGGVNQINTADALFITIIGGSDMKIGEVKKSLETVSNLAKPDTQLVVGANTSPVYKDMVQITVIAIHFDKYEIRQVKNEEKTKYRARPKASKKKEVEEDMPIQGELPLQNISRGIFSNTPAYHYRNEDLDVPTFQRKMIIIDKGDTK